VVSDVEGRVVLVTGAATGIGRALSSRFRADGALVVGVDLPARVEEIGDAADLALGADVTDAASVNAAVDHAVDRFGRLDALVANAGLGRRASIEEAAWDDIEAVVEVNLFGVLHCMRAVLPVMRAAGRGRIVSLVSRNAEICPPNLVGYNVSKAGVVALTRTLSRELRGVDILANNLVPGPTRTEMNPAGDLEPGASYPTARMLVTLPAGGPSGRTFFEERDYPMWERFSGDGAASVLRESERRPSR
jgi:NAD(P)-dependent dehydrogenase (short-subunit alcohol dehydrogenase family)